MGSRPHVQVLMPVYNEEHALPIVLAEWDQMFTENNINYNFVICEDGSNDGTKSILNKLKRKYPITLNQKQYRRGYGRAICDGLSDITADYMLCIDSDGQCDPKDFINLWKMRMPQTIIIGTRVDRKDTKLRRIYSRLFYIYFWLLFGGNILDPSSCFLLADSSVMRKYTATMELAKESFRWGVAATCLKNRIQVKETPINHRKRLSGTTRVFSTSKVIGVVWRGFIGLLSIRFS